MRHRDIMYSVFYAYICVQCVHVYKVKVIKFYDDGTRAL